MSRPALPVTVVRRLAIDAQGYAQRARSGTSAEVAATIDRLAGVQLDSISTVERSHRIVLAARVGAYPRRTVSDLLGAGLVIEYWGHEACLLPARLWPVLRPAMEAGGRHWFREVEQTHPHLREEILDEIRARGPLGSRHFDGASSGMWGWKPAKAMLERLWNHGDLVVAGRQGFQRLYDLPERVIPPELLTLPALPEAERLAVLVEEAVRARGVLTEAGVVEHWRLKGGVARVRPAIDELVASGRLVRHSVEDGGAPILVSADTDLTPPPPTTDVLLSPFDNLLWDRDFARRILGFDHLIEVYKPAIQRRYGYYVLPLLVGDRIAARVDLQTNRRTKTLSLRSLHLEPRVRRSARLDRALERALERLRRTVGAERVEIEPGGTPA